MSGLSASPHLHPESFAGLGAAERGRLLHITSCSSCRRLTAAVLESAPAELPPGTADDPIRRLLDRLELSTGLGAKLAAVEQERLDAHVLVEELMKAPESWGVAGADPRLSSPEVVWQLLLRCEAEDHAPGLRLIDLAADIAVRLSGTSPEVSLYRQLAVEVHCARADRLLDVSDVEGALRELHRAEAILTPDIGFARALYCRSLARLRRQQQRWEEALALAARAAMLFTEHGTVIELGRACIDQAWILVEAGEPDEALALFAAALGEVAGVPAWLAEGQLGLAVASVEGDPVEGAPRVKRLLAEADATIALVRPAEMHLRLRWLAARAAWRCGKEWSAFRRFSSLLSTLLQLGNELDAARVLVELLALCHERGWQEAATERPELRQAIARLTASDRLHRRARAVLAFSLWALQEASPVAAEVVGQAGLYLAASRNQPDLPFDPTRSEVLVALSWDELQVEFRAHICAAAGADPTLAERQSHQLTGDQQDLIAWRYAVREGVGILFGAAVGARAPTPPQH
jgi:hypothetical protein